MLFVITQPHTLAAAAGTLAGVGSGLATENATVAAPARALLPGAVNEASAPTTAQFAAHAQIFQAVSIQAAAIHQQLVAALAANPGSYAATEAANATAPN